MRMKHIDHRFIRTYLPCGGICVFCGHSKSYVSAFNPECCSEISGPVSVLSMEVEENRVVELNKKFLRWAALYYRMSPELFQKSLKKQLPYPVYEDRQVQDLWSAFFAGYEIGKEGFSEEKWCDLLKKYMKHISECESITFVDRLNDPVESGVPFSEEEVSILQKLEKEIYD